MNAERIFAALDAYLLAAAAFGVIYWLLDRAWPDWSYIIVSVAHGKVASAQSWVLNDAERRFYEEPLVVDEGDPK